VTRLFSSVSIIQDIPRLELKLLTFVSFRTGRHSSMDIAGNRSKNPMEAKFREASDMSKHHLALPGDADSREG
jgi:hypothetical protein